MHEKVLIVDDEPEVIEALKAALRREPFQIVGAHSADAAKVMLAREPIGVLVIDERMPGKSGSELLAELAEEHPDVPRIMLTGHADLDLAMRTINTGAVFKFLQKPCDFRELAATIHAAFQIRSVSTTKEKIVDLSRRQASLVAMLERQGGTSDSTGATQEMPAIGGSNTDPVALLPDRDVAALSRREKEILRHLCTGRRPQDVADLLSISVHTARNHIKAIYQKLDVHSQGELIAKVLRGSGRSEPDGPEGQGVVSRIRSA